MVNKKFKIYMKNVSRKVMIKLLTKFVSIASFVDNKHNEKKITKELENFFRVNFSEYKKRKILVEKERYNLLYVPPSPSIIFCCHLDTVLPSNSDSLKLSLKGDRAYGLGAKDMKGGWVAALLAVKGLSKRYRNKVGFLFYCDEEYNQKGIEIMTANSNMIPASTKCFISPESRFNLAYGCRGYAVFEIEIRGKKAHTARSFQGVNAGEKLYSLYNDLISIFKYASNLGETSVTLVGASVGVVGNDKLVVIQDNSVPDYAIGIFSMRIADEKLTKKEIESKIRRALEKGQITQYKICIKSFQSPSKIARKNLLDKFIISAEKIGFSVELANPALAGYNDVAMISSKSKVPMISFGPYGEGNHGPDEYVSVKSMQNTIKIFQMFIQDYNK